MHTKFHAIIFLSLMFVSLSSYSSNNVEVIKMTNKNQHDFPFIIDIEGYDCEDEFSEGGVKSVCTFKAQSINWGMGFCRNDISTLQADVKSTNVNLFIEGVQVSEDTIFMREETYDRQQNKYCHTWLVILANWKIGSHVSLKGVAETSNGIYEVLTTVTVSP